jgi:L-lactate dehydrogenase complex protein LldG
VSAPGEAGPYGAARDVVLDRIRAALRDHPGPPEVSRGYRTQGEHAPGAAALLDLLVDRLIDYKAQVRRCSEPELAATVNAALDDVVPGLRVVVPPGLPQSWTANHDVLRDESTVSISELDTVGAVVTGCAVAVAETGTIVLDAGPDQGRRAITLVPDVHVCVVRAGQVVMTVPEAVRLLDPLRPQTWISGPSATSDIELERVEGVHGPRTLLVILVEP